MTRRADRRTTISERAITLVGLVATLGLAVLVPVIANAKNAKTDVLLGAAGFLVGYVITMDQAMRARLRECEERMLDRLGTVEEKALERLSDVEEKRFGALPLQRLLSVPEIEEAVCDVVGAAADARAKHMQFVANRTIERIKHDRDQTLRIAEGIFRCSDRREEFRLINYALSDCRTSVKAVVGFGLDEWRTPEFAEYFDIYLEYATKVEQTRLFLVTREEMQDRAMIDILEMHARKGVKTYALDRNQLPQQLCRPLVLFDDELLLSYPRVPSKDAIDVHFTDDKGRLEEMGENFTALLRVTRRELGSVLLWQGGGDAGQGDP